LNLKEKYSEDEINVFYTQFARNIKEYEAINPEVVDNLYGFIDFEKFKQNMLLAKNLDNEEF
jgi:hypothetical protein